MKNKYNPFSHLCFKKGLVGWKPKWQNLNCRIFPLANNSRLMICVFLSLLFGFTSCKKFLDKKPVQELVTPASLKDFKALLDDNQSMNYSASPSLLEVSADNYYVEKPSFDLYDPQGKYVWAPNAIDELSWSAPYTKTVFNSNIVIDNLHKIEVSAQNNSEYNYIKGASLFYRAFSFLQLAQAFCNPYSESSNSDLGIVLRLTSAIQAPSKRATVTETYQQIIADFKTAADLLPSKTDFSYQPDKGAAYGALARTYLSMRDYVNAGKYADLAIQQHPTLLDYNTLDLISNNPFININNPEVVFFNTAIPDALVEQTVSKIDTTLFKSYDVNDLRSKVFFRFRSGFWRFKGSYAGFAAVAGSIFGGIATDEMYLIRAECFARAGNITSAMADLNTLLKNRWSSGTYSDMTATDQEDAKRIILIERRKELLFRGLRWSDLRRFNLEGAGIELKRVLDGITYTLPPKDLRWTLLIPSEEIDQSGVPQNPR